MFEIYSEVRAVLSSHVIGAIEGCVMEAVERCVPTARVERLAQGEEVRYQLIGTLDGILIAKTRLEELLAGLAAARRKESSERDSTTLSDEGDTSYDRGPTTSCPSDDRERETNASSNGYVSTTTEGSVRTLRLRQPLSKKLRFILKERPRRASAPKRKPLPPPPPNDPDRLSENLRHMKLATEESDSEGCKGRPADPSHKHACKLCAFKTKRSSHFAKHMAIHEKVLSCPHCSYRTTRQHYYERHQRTHCSRRTLLHQCEQCRYKTHRKEHFVRHVSNVHGDKRPHLCHLCGKAFKRGDALRQHGLTHAGAEGEDHRCGACGKGFRSRSHLCEHRAVHSEVRSFLCEVCGASFKTRSVHRKHVLSIHRNPRAYACDACPKKFNTLYALKRHRKLHAGKPPQRPENGGATPSPIPSDPSPPEAPVSDVPVLPSATTEAPAAPLPVVGTLLQAHEPTTLLFLTNNLPHFQ